jgi:hypothetical protein
LLHIPRYCKGKSNQWQWHFCSSFQCCRHSKSLWWSYFWRSCNKAVMCRQGSGGEYFASGCWLASEWMNKIERSH